MKELISIVVPMYFEEEVANECYNRLLSVMHENHINYEFIFVNDGSTDRTIEILKDVAAMDSNVKLLILPVISGTKLPSQQVLTMLKVMLS